MCKAQRQKKLRNMVKMVKAEYDDIDYKDLALYIELNTNSFYNWLNGYYNLSAEKEQSLYEIVIDLLGG